MCKYNLRIKSEEERDHEGRRRQAEELRG